MLILRVDVAASTNPTLRIYDEGPLGTYTDDVLEITITGSDKRAGEHFLMFIWDNNNSEWDLVHDTRGSARGMQTVFIPARAMTARTTNGAAAGSSETTTNKIMVETLDFDAATNEFAQFEVTMPKGWNEGTVYAQFYWTAASGTGDVIFGLQGVSMENNEQLDSAFGTAQEITDTLINTDRVHVTSYTAAITVSGAAEDSVTYFQAYRNAADAGDTFSADAKLIGVKLLFMVEVANDD